VSTDEVSLLVGADQDDSSGIRSGAAYLYEKSSTGAWVQKIKLKGSDTVSGDKFGAAVSISADRAVVSAPLKSGEIGAVYVFSKVNGAWIQEVKLSPLDAVAGKRFGNSVSILGNVILVGAERDSQKAANSGAVYVFQQLSGVWSQIAKLIPTDARLNSFFGHSVALNFDSVSGLYALIGAVGRGGAVANFTGGVYFYRQITTGWVQSQVLVSRTPLVNSYFGSSISVKGNRVAIGADYENEGRGAAYIFEKASTAWSQVAKLSMSSLQLLSISEGAPGKNYSSNTITISGLSGPTALSITGAGSIVKNGVDVGSSTTVVNGDQVYFKQKSPAGTNLTSTLQVSLGSESTSWSVSNVTVPALADLPGAVAGKSADSLNVTDQGDLNYSLPLTVPAGSGGLSPSLSVSYSSKAGNGFLGMGWRLDGISIISRCSSSESVDGITDPVDFDDNDRFCIDGDRLLVTNNSVYGANGSEYRTEIETFTKITSYGTYNGAPEYFKVYRKDGLIYYYGNSTDSRISTQKYPSPINWALSRVEDRLGNYYTISYETTPGSREYKPVQINYTGNSRSGLLPYNRIVFQYEDRQDKDPIYVAGDYFSFSKRLKKIDVYDKSQLFRSYELAYVNGHHNARSHLLSFRECGTDGTCLPPTTFEWQGLSPVEYGFGAQGSGAWGDGSVQPGNSSLIADFDGNGKSYIVAAIPGRNGYLPICYSENNNLNCGLFVVPREISINSPNIKSYLGDFNGDGKSDIFYAGASGVTYVCTGISSNTSCRKVGGSRTEGTYANNNIDIRYDVIMPGDFNGDEKSEIIHFYRANRGIGASEICYIEDNYLQCKVLGGLYFFNNDLFKGDFNGDGKDDLVGGTFSNGGYSICSFQGSDFDCQHKAMPEIGRGINYIGDFNGDGLSDIGATNGDHAVVVCISDGVGFTCRPWTENGVGLQDPKIGDFNGDGKADLAIFQGGSIWNVRLSSGIDFNGAGSGSWTGAQTSSGDFSIGDFNGDGATDIAVASGNASDVSLSKTLKPNLLTKITNGLGLETAISYLPMSDESVHKIDDEAIYPLGHYRSSALLVSSIKSPDGIGGIKEAKYLYGNGKVDVTGRGFVGFSWVELSSAENKVKKYFLQDYNYAGSNLLKFETKLPSGQVTRKIDYVNKYKVMPSGSKYSYLESETETVYDLSQAVISTKTTNSTYDDYGNIVTSLTTTGDLQTEKIENTFEVNTANWFLGKLKKATVTKSNHQYGPASRTNEYAYDPVTGVLVEETIEPGHPSLWLKKKYTYDLYGNITRSETSGGGIVLRTALSTYDGDGRYLLRNTNALGHIEQFTFSLAKLSSRTNANGLKTFNYYDGFSRAVRSINPDRTEERTFYRICGQSCPVNAVYYIYSQKSGFAPAIDYYDVLERVVRNERVGLGGKKVYVDTEYTASGQLKRQSEPYFAGEQALWTTYEYDAYQRVTKEVRPGNKEYRRSYSGLSVTTTEPNGNSSTIVIDQSKKVLKSIDSMQGETNYLYDPFGNLTLVTDPNGISINNSYDIRGNVVNSSNPNSRTSTREYSALGEMLSETTSDAPKRTFRYDKLGRVISRVSQIGSTNWRYDVGNSAKGALSSLVSTEYGNSKIDLFYDDFSRLSRKEHELDNEKFIVSKYYDRYSREEATVHPNGFYTLNKYTPEGRLASVEGANAYVFWTMKKENAGGQIEQYQLGNKLTTDITYTSDMYLPQTIKTGNVQSLSMAYDIVGNITQRRDVRLNLTENFTYDSLNRLTSSAVVGQTPVSLTYDKVGNIKTKSDTGTYNYDIARPYAVTSIVGPRANTYTYDDRGNRVTGNGERVAYTWFNVPNYIQKGPETLNFSFDGSQSRYKQVKQNATGLTTITYVDGIFEREVSGTTTVIKNYVSVNGEMIAVHRTTAGGGAQLNYLHKDHLGSVQTITNEKGALVEVLSFDPWGLRRKSNWASGVPSLVAKESRGFTGHEHLDGVNLIHMNGRVYDPMIGRFLSPDKFIQDPLNSQNYGVYSYVLNNPLTMTDPSGLFFKGLKRLIKNTVKGIVASLTDPKSLIVNAVAFFVTQGLSSYFQIVGYAKTALKVFTSSFANSVANGVSVGRSFVVGARDSLLNFGMETIAPRITAKLGGNKFVAATVNVGLSGGVSVAKGGDFVHGAFGSFSHFAIQEAQTAILGAYKSSQSGGNNFMGTTEHDVNDYFDDKYQLDYKDSLRDRGFFDVNDSYVRCGYQSGLCIKNAAGELRGVIHSEELLKVIYNAEPPDGGFDLRAFVEEVGSDIHPKIGKIYDTMHKVEDTMTGSWDAYNFAHWRGVAGPDGQTYYTEKALEMGTQKHVERVKPAITIIFVCQKTNSCQHTMH
jgi:RHS repeat-associated protein